MMVFKVGRIEVQHMAVGFAGKYKVGDALELSLWAHFGLIHAKFICSIVAKESMTFDFVSSDLKDHLGRLNAAQRPIVEKDLYHETRLMLMKDMTGKFDLLLCLVILKELLNAPETL